MADITFNGMTMEFNVVAGMMDEELKKSVVDTLGSDDEQDLLDAYLKAHKEKFGREFLQN